MLCLKKGNLQVLNDICVIIVCVCVRERDRDMRDYIFLLIIVRVVRSAARHLTQRSSSQTVF